MVALLQCALMPATLLTVSLWMNPERVVYPTRNPFAILELSSCFLFASRLNTKGANLLACLVLSWYLADSHGHPITQLDVRVQIWRQRCVRAPKLFHPLPHHKQLNADLVGFYSGEWNKALAFKKIKDKRSKIDFSDCFDVSSGPPARRVGAGFPPQPEGHRRGHGWTLWPQVNTKYHPFYDLCTYVVSTYYDIRILNIYLGIGTRLPRSQTWCARSKRQISRPRRQFLP